LRQQNHSGSRTDNVGKRKPASMLGAIVLASPATSLISSATSGAVQAAGSPQAASPMDG
jgi:hypothetical protein